MKKLSNKSKRIVLMIIIPIIGVVLLSGAVFGISYGYLNRNTLRLDYNPDEEFQTFYGFGTSSAWNMRIIGRDYSEEMKQTLTNYLYGDDGLELSIYRYNLGAGSTEVEEITYGEERKTESFFIAQNYVDNSSFSDINNYDFSKDNDYLSMLELAIKTNNVKKVVIFSNSPHYLLTKNHLIYATNEHENNLPEENFEAFSEYVLICSTYIDSFIKSLGYNDIEIAISPVNEPQWKWGGSEASQEGCHFDADHLAKFYDVFYKVLNKYNTKNNTSFKMDIYESGNYKLGLASSKNKDYFKAFSKYEYFDQLDSISMHSYAADTDKTIKSKFASYYKKYHKSFAMSEYCVMQPDVDPSISMGIKSAKVLMQDLNILNATEWSWWLGVAMGGWEDGLVYLNAETKDINLYYRYYMYGQFMKYIEKGDIRIRADIHDIYDFGGVDSVAFKKPDGTIVLILLNDNNKQKTIELKSRSYNTCHIVETYENNYWVESDKAFDGDFVVKPNSVTTIILK